MNKQMLQACLQCVISESQPYAIKATTAEIKVATQKQLWVQSDRILIRNALEAVLNSGVDTLGLQRFILPAEYIASVIAIVVSPVNWKIACIHLSNTNVTTLDVMAGYAEQKIPMNPNTLFSIVLLAAAESDAVNINLETSFASAIELENETD